MKFEVGDKIKVISDTFGKAYNGLVLEVVPEGKCTSADQGVWLDKRTAEVSWLNGCWIVNDFELVSRAVSKKPKRFQVGDRVISTKNTPEIPEGFVGYVVEAAEQDNYDYAVSPVAGDSTGIVEYFNEDELELLSASKEKMQELKDLTDKIDKVPPSDYEFLTYGPSLGKEEHTGGSVNYYKVFVTNPTTLEQPYYAEANDIIESLGLTFAEGNLLKAVWRIAADRNGKKKKGNNSVYDAEKLVFFAERVLAQEKSK